MMTIIKIKNFGPIREGYAHSEGFFEIPKVTIFIGNQGSGKSTVAKLISTFVWMEKALVRGDYTENSFSGTDFRNERLAYHRLENYLNNNTEIEYRGDAYTFIYKDKILQINKIDNTAYSLPQIIYVPAERNIVANSANAGKLKIISPSLIDFLGEYTNALSILKTPVVLPINNTKIEYDTTKNIVYVIGKDYRIPLAESASGFQSLAPLYLVSQYLCNSIKNTKDSEAMNGEEKKRFSEWSAKILADTALTDDQKRMAISEYAKRFNKTSFINIIEEPELNLFPAAQNFILQKLLEFNNSPKTNGLKNGNKLVITTHSPYLINFLTLAVEADKIKKHCKTKGLKDELNELSEIIPLDSTLSPNDMAIYELNEKDGAISLLEPYDGLPSDENQLNKHLGDANDLFSRLICLEQRLCL